jgi:hypothetical protein
MALYRKSKNDRHPGRCGAVDGERTAVRSGERSSFTGTGPEAMATFRRFLELLL